MASERCVPVKFKVTWNKNWVKSPHQTSRSCSDAMAQCHGLSAYSVPVEPAKGMMHHKCLLIPRTQRRTPVNVFCAAFLHGCTKSLDCDRSCHIQYALRSQWLRFFATCTLNTYLVFPFSPHSRHTQDTPDLVPKDISASSYFRSPLFIGPLCDSWSPVT